MGEGDLEDPSGLFGSRGCTFSFAANTCHTDRGRDLNHPLLQITFTKGQTTKENSGIVQGHMGCQGATTLLSHGQGNL